MPIRKSNKRKGTVEFTPSGPISVAPARTAREFFKRAEVFTSGGGSGARPVAIPTPVEKKQLEVIQEARVQRKVSPIQATRERAIRARLIRETARLRNIKLTSQARQRGFVQKLQREIKTQAEQAKKQHTTRQKIFDETIRTAELKLKRSPPKKLKDLEKERNSINEGIIKLNKKFKGDLTLQQRNRYEKELAPLVARFKVYSESKNKIIKKMPSKDIKAEIIFDPILGQNVLVASAKDKGVSKKISRAVNKALTKIQRGKGTALTTLGLAGLTALQVGEETVAGFKALPSVVKSVIKDPRILKKIPGAIKKTGRDLGFLLKVSPTAGLVKIGANIFVMKGTSSALRVLGKTSSATLVRLNPKFVGVAKTGKTLNIKTGKAKSVKLDVVGKIPKKSIPGQIRLAGEKVTAISSQADRLLGVLKRTKALQKPLGKTKLGKRVEDVLGKKAGSLLKKVDLGKDLTRKQITFLNRKIREAGSKGLLERSFFADPTRKIRPSRLGIIQPRKFKLIDYFTEDITFKKAKPQILLFEDIRVQTFPTQLKPIVKKLKSGKVLTEGESSRLLEFQLKKSGKFKPLGFVTRESEITLAPGEVLKRVKKVGVTRIEGRNVPIIKSEVFKPKGKTKTLLAKYRKGTATAKEIQSLNVRLKKKTGFSYGLSSKTKVGLRRLSIKRIGASALSRTIKRKISKKAISKPPSRKPVSRPSGKVRYTSRGRPYVVTSKGARFISSDPVSKPSKPKPSPPRITVPPSKPPVKPIPKKPTPPIKVGKRRKIKVKKKPSKKLQVFNVFGKSGKKFVKLNIKPLTKEDALSRGTYVIDQTTSRTYKIVPAGKLKKPGALRKAEKNYFKRQGFKLREHRIKGGRRFALKNKYIEKTKRAIDTPGEKKGLTIAKFLKQQRRGGIVKRKKRVTTKKKKITPARRKVMLQNLKKARRILKQQRKKR